MNNGFPLGTTLLVLLAVALLAAVAILVGPLEALVLLVGMGVLSATVWFSPFASRVAGSIYVALVVAIIARLFSTTPIGIGIGLLAGVGAWILFSVRVHRRVCFMIPSLVLLIFVTCILMYSAPGSPFAG